MSPGHAAQTPLTRWRSTRARHDADRRYAILGWIDRIAILVFFVLILYTLVGSTPFQHEVIDTARNTEGSSLNRYIWFALLGLSLPVLWARFTATLGLLKAIWPLLLLYMWFGLTTLWAIDPAASQRRFLSYSIALVIALAVTVGIRRSRTYLATMAAACALVMLIDFASWIFLPSLSMTKLGLAGLHSQKNTLGFIAMFSSFVIAACALGQKTLITRLLWWGMVAVTLLVLAASQSKTSLILALSAFLLAPVITLVARGSVALIWISVVMIPLVAVLALFLWLGICGISGIDPMSPLHGVTFTSRTDVWSYVLSEIAKHPWTGAGFGSFWDIDPALQPSLRSGLWFADIENNNVANEAHNGYLDLTVTTGYIGSIGAILLLARWIWLAFRTLRTMPDTIGGHLVTGPDKDLPLAILSTIFLVFFAYHNLLESSYFYASNYIGGLIFLFFALKVEQWNRDGKVAAKNLRPDRQRPLPWRALRESALAGRS
ncbi:MAG: O-antigen ligase family protein [Parvibaculaceae bacterium]|nr:O-antigen ligase family protein [Parvibaculaceae bacterium]